MLQALGNFGVEKLTEIANDLYDSDDIPEELTKSIFDIPNSEFPIPKKPGSLKCEQYRTISLMSHAIKIFLLVILKRIRRAILPEIASEQFGFVKDAGTRNAMFVLRSISERMLQVDKPLFLCFIDYSKAFDKVEHEALLKLLQQLDIDSKDLRLLRNLYCEQTAGVRIRNEVRQYTKIKRGVRQGCVLSPDLFNLYSEMILRHLKHQPGISINGNNINNIRYADDTVLIADHAENLQSLLNTVVARSAEYDQTIPTAKTKCMVISKSGDERCNLIMENNTIEQVQYFNYLGFYITSDGRCTKEIRRRTNLARSAFEKMGKFFKDRKISIKTKFRIFNCYINPILTYGSESSTLRARDEDRLRATEMFFSRRMLRFSWTDFVTNEEVLTRAVTHRTLINNIRKRQCEFFGHILRKGQLEHLNLPEKSKETKAEADQE